MVNLTKALGGYGNACRLQVSLRRAEALRPWHIEVTPKEATLGPPSGKPDLHLTLDEGVWLQIATGELAPLAAFVTGQLRVVGDCALAKSLYRKLARPGAQPVSFALM